MHQVEGALAQVRASVPVLETGLDAAMNILDVILGSASYRKGFTLGLEVSTRGSSIHIRSLPYLLANWQLYTKRCPDPDLARNGYLTTVFLYNTVGEGQT